MTDPARTPPPADGADDPLVAEAMKRAAIAWLAVGDRPPVGVWCLAADGVLYVVAGPGEQDVPGLADAAAPGGPPVAVTLRGDHGGRIVTFPAAVGRVDPAAPEWPDVAGQLAAKRLNAPGPTADLVARWAAECAVVRLAPGGPPRPRPGDAGAAPPRETPAARPARKPFRLHRVRRR
ncbi:hypothetical protein GCM10010123_22330 [Pilimelia anulata]|uniref:Uncharacterized protein n=1 Tax=Pilimelia anulata TaxID=53371 RepID=A0A8J3FCK9_9ACTN|nr:hypothetical protein [Pilimelia anulata]GGJ92068.1 hypothetical protein GCM10010123_22330 [Pilimelia anulata]